jgi:hypothetical protein
MLDKKQRSIKMARRAFYSFHYKPDNWRASQVRNMGIVDGNKPATDNDWEKVKKGGDEAIQKWIDNQLSEKSVVIVLIGSKTARRKWINYEIKKAWENKKGILGIYVHNLKDSEGKQTTKGDNPFNVYKIDNKSMSDIVKAYDSPFEISTDVYNYIKRNLADWIEKAIEIRNSN